MPLSKTDLKYLNRLIDSRLNSMRKELEEALHPLRQVHNACQLPLNPEEIRKSIQDAIKTFPERQVPLSWRDVWPRARLNPPPVDAPPRHGEVWSRFEEERLKDRFLEFCKTCAKFQGRYPEAITERIAKMMRRGEILVYTRP
jgi:ribosomal protein L29